MKNPNTLRFTGKDTSILGHEKIKLLKAIENKLKSIKDYNDNQENEISGNLPGIFVGQYGYPNVNAGFLASKQIEENNNPILWSKNPEKFDISKIISLRSSLLNSKFQTPIRGSESSFKEKLQEVSMSIKPVDADVKLEYKPKFRLNINKDLLPMGPSAPLEKLTLTTNPKIPVSIEKTYYDDELKAVDALEILYKKGVDENKLSTVLSSGSFGLKLKRKIVPTKWSITAVDDSLGKNLAGPKLNDYYEHEFAAYFGGYFGNYYLAIVFPGPFSYELFETYVGPGLINPSEFESATDYEGVMGRKTYASNTVGGYYASRLAVLEHFESIKRKGRVLLLRFITDEYFAPLGVWVVRQATRKTMQNKPLIFDSQERMLKYAKILLKTKFNVDFDVFLEESKLIHEIKHQKTLNNY